MNTIMSVILRQRNDFKLHTKFIVFMCVHVSGQVFRGHGPQALHNMASGLSYMLHMARRLKKHNIMFSTLSHFWMGD